MNAQKARHPAKFNRAIIDRIVHIIDWHTTIPTNARILDPFGGTGKIFDILEEYPGLQITALEIEPNWASHDPRVTTGNALDNGFENEFFDMIITSPTYGNRMADHHNAKDGSKRNTYTHAYGEKLHPDNSGILHWGEKYRDFHVRAWKETIRVLKSDGFFLLNIKDHIRGGERQFVTDWHKQTLMDLGLYLIDEFQVESPGNRQGQNADLRLDFESLVLLQKGNGFDL